MLSYCNCQKCRVPTPTAMFKENKTVRRVEERVLRDVSCEKVICNISVLMLAAFSVPTSFLFSSFYFNSPLPP